MNRLLRTCLFVFALSTQFLVIGCGGTDDSTTQPPNSMTVQWPDRSRAIQPPMSALSFAATIGVRASNSVEIVGNRGANTAPHSATYQSSGTGVLGSANVRVRFYSEANQGGSVVAEATFQSDIGSDGAIASNVTLDSKVASVQVPSGQKVFFGEEYVLVATAMDANANVIALNPTSIIWQVVAGETVLSFTNGTATGLKVGDASVKATIDGKESSATSVQVPAAAELILIPEFRTQDPINSVRLELSADGTTLAGDTVSKKIFRWRQGTGMETFVAPFEDVTRLSLTGISGNGELLGGRIEREEDKGGAWLWDAGTFTFLEAPSDMYPASGDIQAISADGTVLAGHFSGASGPRAYKWVRGQAPTRLPSLAGGEESYVHAMSSDGTVVVGGQTVRTPPASGPTLPVRFLANTAEMIPIPEGWSGLARGVSADGAVVVGSAYPPNPGPGLAISRAFRWTAAGGTEFISPVSEGNPIIARATSAEGSIVVGVEGSGTSFVWTLKRGYELLKDYLKKEYGLETDQTLDNVQCISADGKVLASAGKFQDGWLVRPVKRN